MKQTLTLADKLLAKLKKLGMPERKAKEVAKGLTPTAQRAVKALGIQQHEASMGIKPKVSGTVTGKLEAKLLKLGLSERKAKELAKGLAPLVRAAIKAKVRKAAIKLDDVVDDDVNTAVDEATDAAEDEELDKVAPRVNGHRVRLDLPVVSRDTWQREPVKGIELLRVIDGFSTRGTYLIAAVKSDEGMVAVRQLGQSYFNVKFYPHMGYWGKTQEELRSLGAHSYLAREWYQRMHMDGVVLEEFLRQLALEAKPLSRLQALISRMKTVTAAPLLKAFGYLHKRIGVAA